MAIQMYANVNKGNFPRTNFDPKSTSLITSNQGWDSPASFSKDGPSPVGDNNVTASVFLLLKTQDLTSEVFVCPSTAGVGDRFHNNSQGAAGQSNFSDIGANLSYSYMVPFPSQAARNMGLKLNYTLTSDFAIAADMNPGGPALLTTQHDAGHAQMQQVNSNNHNGDGENVLYADGHVEFQNNPFVGKQRKNAMGIAFGDNIYTVGEPPAAVEAQPADAQDSILLPVDPAGPGHRNLAAMSPMSGATTWLIAAAGVIIVVILLIIMMVKRAAIRTAEQTSPPMPPAL